LRSPPPNPSGDAGADEADVCAVDRGGGADGFDSTHRVGCDEVEVAVLNVGRDQRTVGETRLLAAAMHPDDGRVSAALDRQIERA